MPVLDNSDILSFTGTYLIYARESFSFPIGLVKGLSFPFEAANISRGSIPLFAILFKGLAKLYPPFSGYYYFIIVELLSVFLVAYFTCLLLSSFKITSFWLKLLGTVLVALSFPLLFRSSGYYGVTFIVASFPVYIACAYFYTRIYRNANFKSLLLFACIFPVAALIDYYLLFGLLFLTSFCLCLNCIETMLNNNRLNRNRVWFIMLAFLLGVILSSQMLFILGNQSNLEAPADSSDLIIGRYSEGWGYGGGGGGGFHVADVLDLVVPPKDSDGKVPIYRRCGPTAYLTKLGWPLTTNDLQDGQYEGFAYLGTVTIGILFFMIMIKIISLMRNIKKTFVRFRLKLMTKFFMHDKVFSLPIIIGLSTFLLYVFSWGYIVHVGGLRFNNIITPSLALAILWPKFVFARSLGRLAIPFMLFVVIATIVYLNKYLRRNMCFSDKRKKILCIAAIIFLIMVHLHEIQGYLRPPEVTYGNDIVNVFGRADRIAIKELLQNKKAIMLVPALRDNKEWTKIGYALAFYSNIPISGATVGFGELSEQMKQYDMDISFILSGRINEIIDRYGNVAIAAPPSIADSILRNSNVHVKLYKLQSTKVSILIPDIKIRGTGYEKN